MRRTGFVYTLFAMLMIGLIFSLTVADFDTGTISRQGEKLRIDEVSYFLGSITDDLERASTIIGRRALTALTNEVVTDGVYLDDAEAAFEEAFVNGTVNGTFSPIMNRSTIKNWTAAMQNEAAKSQYELEMEVTNVSVGIDDHMHITLNTSYHVNLTDPISESRFNRTTTVRRTISYRGIEDPLILVESAGRYANVYTDCSGDDPTPFNTTGSTSFYNNTRDWVSGTAVTRPGNGSLSGVSNKAEKVAVVGGACSYTESEIRNDLASFAGVVSETGGVIDATNGQNSVDMCGYSDVEMEALIDGAGNATSVENGSMAVMTGAQLWQNDLQNWTKEDCYFSDPWAPSFWDRLEGRFSRPTYGAGPAFLMTVPDLPLELQEGNESAIAYVYFGNTSSFGQPHKIKGVTNEDLSWFRLDQDHIDHWNINALSYD